MRRVLLVPVFLSCLVVASGAVLMVTDRSDEVFTTSIGSDDVEVRDLASVTTVDGFHTDGGIRAFERSSVQVLGGSIGSLDAFDRSNVIVLGGRVSDAFSNGVGGSRDQPTLTIRGGRIGSAGANEGAAVANIHGGFIDTVLVGNCVTVNISGGMISEIRGAAGSLNMFGGTVRGACAFFGVSFGDTRVKLYGGVLGSDVRLTIATLDMFGGVVQGDIIFSDHAEARLYGGRIHGIVDVEGLLIVHGFNLELQIDSIVDGLIEGRITGRLADGTNLGQLRFRTFDIEAIRLNNLVGDPREEERRR